MRKSILAALAVIALGVLPLRSQTGSTTPMTNDQTFVCTLGLPNCVNVPSEDGGTIWFTTTQQTDPHTGQHYFTETLRISTADYSGFIQLLPVTSKQTELGTPGCNSTNQWTLTVLPTATTDGAGKPVTVSMTQVLTQIYSGYGRNAGCHYVSLHGTTTIAP